MRPHQRLTRQDFALFRGYLDGVPLEHLHSRYSLHADLRHTRTHLAWLRDALSIAARRAQDPAAARLLLLRPGSLNDQDKAEGSSPESGSTRALRGGSTLDLETFRADFDPDGFYSEAELLEIYSEKFQNERAQSDRKRGSRRRRLRERQAEVLARLEATFAELPDPSHELDTWLEPALAKRLGAAGLVTLADLLALIERYRWRWYVQVPRVGPKAASRITTWLAANSPSLRHKLSVLALTPRRQIPVDHADLARRVTSEFPRKSDTRQVDEVVPLEALRPPPGLDGTTGSNRGTALGSSLAANTDLAAIQDWLAIRVDGAHTKRAYRREAERLLLWTLIEKRKAFSSLTALDATEYLDAFLKDPQPATRWVGQRRVERFDAAWRPFNGPLSERSREAARSILRALCAWLVERRYLSTNPFASQKPIRSFKPFDAAGHAFSREQWALLLASLDRNTPTLRERRDECALMLAYATGLRRAELASLTTENLCCALGGTGDRDLWEIRIAGTLGVKRTLPLPMTLTTRLQDYFAARALPRNPHRCLPGTPVLSDARGRRPVTAHGLGYIFKKIFERTSGEMAVADPVAADLIARATTHWLRHSYANHALDSGADLPDLSRKLGHARLATTATYPRRKRDI